MLMNQIFQGLSFKTLIVYIDDILVDSENFESHLVALKRVFDGLRHTGLRLHVKKCHFAMPEILYLEHKISGEGINVGESKIEVVKNGQSQNRTKMSGHSLTTVDTIAVL